MPFSTRSWRYLILWSILIISLVYVAARIRAFAHIFGQHAGVILTQTEVAQAYKDNPPDPDSATVPRIIHQIFHNWTHPSDETIPSDWLEARQTCIDSNEDWQHWLWTVEKSHTFIAENYPWFLKTYENFKYPVQRIDALRYFLLRHYGGIYIDLDNGCMTSLEPLRYYPAWVVDGARGALSNDILGAEPQHPFWILLTDSIIPYAWNYPLPYITISYATGQWFETAIWEEYHRRKPQDAPVLTRINTDGRPGASPRVFFTHTRGGTWDNWDNRMFAWIGEHLLLFIIIVVGLIGLTVTVAVFAAKQVSRLLASRRGRFAYSKVDSIELESE